MSNSYRDLIAWQKALALVTHVYRWTEAFPKSELYGLTNQMRRAAVSVVANIAEGQGRGSRPQFQQFLNNAKGSLVELETHFYIAKNLGYFSSDLAESAFQMADEVSRLVNGLLRSLGEGEKGASAGH